MLREMGCGRVGRWDRIGGFQDRSRFYRDFDARGVKFASDTRARSEIFSIHER